MTKIKCFWPATDSTLKLGDPGSINLFFSKKFFATLLYYVSYFFSIFQLLLAYNWPPMSL